MFRLKNIIEFRNVFWDFFWVSLSVQYIYAHFI